MKTLLSLFAAVASGLAFLSSAHALTAYAVTQGNRLLTFDTNTPAVVSSDVAITFNPANPAYSVVGIALRTTTQPGSSNAGAGSLWGIAYNGTNFFLCVINPATAVATQVGGILNLDDSANADAFGFGFDPAADRFRFISVQFNYAINPNTLTAEAQTSFPGFPAHSGAAFAPVPYTGGTSRFYNVSRQVDPRRLQTSDNIATGVVTTVGTGNLGSISAPLGLTFGGDTLFLAADEDLLTVNLSTGASTLVGGIMGNPTIRALAVVPASLPPVASLAVKISGKKKFATSSATRTIKGTVKSNAGIDRVEYRLGSGKYKRVKGNLAKWKFTANLKPGKNVISVRAKVGTITSKIAKVTVTRN